MLGKNTILKAIHNIEITSPHFKNLRMLGKNTILKAIHNLFGCLDRIHQPANAR